MQEELTELLWSNSFHSLQAALLVNLKILMDMEDAFMEDDLFFWFSVKTDELLFHYLNGSQYL